jgi:hypothetical protein
MTDISGFGTATSVPVPRPAPSFDPFSRFPHGSGLGRSAPCVTFKDSFYVRGMMDSLLPAVVVVLIVVLIVVMLVFFQNQQVRQLQGIYDRLGAMKAGDEPKQDPEALRRERAERIGGLVMLEADLARTGRDPTEDELASVDAARAAVRSTNEALKQADEWMGPPFDLEWVEILERMPEIRKRLLGAETGRPGPALNADS